jgi:hypothetical protein
MNWRWALVALLTGPGLSLAGGLVFVALAVHDAAAADDYRAALPCQAAGAGQTNCYELRDAVIESVHISQTRTGEQDDVVLATVDGTLLATLEPASAVAPHVRTGASVTAKVYRGEVTLVTVDGLTVSSSANPAANQSQYRLYAIYFFGSTPVFLLLALLALRRRRSPTLRPATAASPAMPLQPSVLPDGRIGTIVAPHAPRFLWLQGGAVVFALLVVSARWLLTPRDTFAVAVADAAIVVALAAALALYLRNARLFASGDGLGRVDWLGRRTQYPAGSISRAVRLTVAGRRRNSYLAFVGPDDREMFKLANAYWDAAQLETACERAGVPVVGSYADVVSVYRANRRVGGSIRWGRDFLIAGVIVAAIIAAIVALDGPSTR